MEPTKNKPAQQDENPMAGYDPKDRNFQNTDDAPVASNQEEEDDDEFDDYDEEMDELEDEEEDETKDQTV